MEWNAIFELIDPQLLIVVAVCWVAGYVLKQTPKVPDWSIVYGVTVIGIVSTSLLLEFGIQSVLQGILCGAFAVYGNQLVKQTKEGVTKDE